MTILKVYSVTLLIEEPFKISRRPIVPYTQHIFTYISDKGALKTQVWGPWNP